MRCLVSLTLAVMCLGAADPSAQARFLSFAVTDHPPTAAEARALDAGDVTVASLRDQWLESDPHLDRVARFFHDMFGYDERVPTYDEPFLVMTGSNGVVQRTLEAPCDPDLAIDVDAWWLEPGETVAVCPEVVAEPMCALEYDDFGCGCGPRLIGCAPVERLDRLMWDLAREFADRAVYAYLSAWTWFDLLGGYRFVGNRYMFHAYLFQQWILPHGLEPHPDDTSRLADLPPAAAAEAPFPEGPERAGVVTSPAFLARFNNFRSRVRAITEKLLCQDADYTLNTSDIATFVNPDHDELTLSHSDKTDCAACHYAIDNIGSGFLGWGADGYYEEQLSQKAHVFGQDGEGPAFVMQRYVEHGDGFEKCMAKTVFEDFTGEPWAALPEATRRPFVKAAATGPRALIRAILTSDRLLTLR